RRRRHRLPRPQHRLRLPELQPAPGPHGLRERRVPAAPRRRAGRRAARADDGDARGRGPRRPARAAAQPALPRAEAARRRRARPRQEAGARPRRRADRQPRHQDRRGDHRPHAPRPGRAGGELRLLDARPAAHLARRRDLRHPRRPSRGGAAMMTWKIAFRNLLRNRRRSAVTLLAIAVGAVGIVLFGEFVRFVTAGLETGAVARVGHLTVYKKGYFAFGAGNPGEYGIDGYADVVQLIRGDAELAPALSVVTPIVSLAGIAGNFDIDASKTFLGTGV